MSLFNDVSAAPKSITAKPKKIFKIIFKAAFQFYTTLEKAAVFWLVCECFVHGYKNAFPFIAKYTIQLFSK